MSNRQILKDPAPCVLRLTREQRQQFVNQLLFKQNADSYLGVLAKELPEQPTDFNTRFLKAIHYNLSVTNHLLDLFTIMINPTRSELDTAVEYLKSMGLVAEQMTAPPPAQ